MYFSIPAILSLLSIIEGLDWNNQSEESKKAVASYALPLFLKKSEILKQYGLDEESDIGKLREDIDRCYVGSANEKLAFCSSCLGTRKDELWSYEWRFDLGMLESVRYRPPEYKANPEIIEKFINDLSFIQEKYYYFEGHAAKVRYLKLYDVLSILAAQEVFAALRLRNGPAETDEDHSLLQILKENDVFEKYKTVKLRQFKKIYLSTQYPTLDIIKKFQEYRNKWQTINNFEGYEDVRGMKNLIEKCINHNNFSFDLNEIDTDGRMQKKFSKIADILPETGVQAEKKYKIYKHQAATEKIVKLYEFLAVLATEEYRRRGTGNISLSRFRGICEKIHYYKYDSKKLTTKLKEYRKRAGELTKYGIDKNMTVDKLKKAIDECFRGSYLYGFRFNLKNIAEDRRLQTAIARAARVAYENFEHDDAKRIYAGLYELLAILAAHQGNYVDFKDLYVKMKDTEFAIKQNSVVQPSRKILDKEATEMLNKLLEEQHVLERCGIDAERDADIFKDYNCLYEISSHASEIFAAITRETKGKRKEVCKVSLILAGQHISMAERKFEKIDIKMRKAESKIKKTFIKNLFTKIAESYTTSKEEKILKYQKNKKILTFYSIKSMADAETIEANFSKPMTNKAGSKMIPDMKLIYNLMLTMAAQDVAEAQKKFVQIFQVYKKL